ncbi:MAG: hypothetical protein WD097_07605, partial [Balneolales bacterium]
AGRRLCANPAYDIDQVGKTDSVNQIPFKSLFYRFNRGRRGQESGSPFVTPETSTSMQSGTQAKWPVFPAQ